MNDHPAHRFTFVYRGPNHIHRYTPRCTCGWWGVHRRSVDKARAEWDIHAAQATRRAVRTRTGRGSNERELTPHADLPEALQ